jgi:vitamin B12 transporter
MAAQSITDTIFQVPDVVISASRHDHFRQDVKSEEFSSAELLPYAGESLGRFLTGETSLNIKAYGVGGATSSLSIRGASASQVQVNWNGFPINSVTLGSSDISMIPAAGFDRVSVVYGASGALYGSGTFGGAVSLSSDLQPEEAVNGNAFISVQSLHALTGGLSFKAGTQRLAWKIFAWGTVSENEFTYYDYIKQSDRKQTDGDWKDFGMIQNFAIKVSSSSTLEAGLWYQVKPYDIPSRIGSVTYEHQADSTLRLYLGYKYLGNRWSLKVKAARFSDRQNYWQKASANATVNSIDSRIASVQYYSDVNFRYYLSSGLSFDAGLTGSLVTADVSAYGGEKEEKGVALFTGVKYSLNRLALQAVVRKEWYNTFSSGLLPSLGLSWEALADKWTLRANYSQKFRKPTFNDLYWMPGGNLSLNPENGYTVEAGSEVRLWKNENSGVSAEISPYYTNIREMIVWRPDGAYWIAMNYRQVKSAGIDILAKFNTEKHKWEYISTLKVTLNHSESIQESDDEQEPMLYSPRIITSWKNSFTAGIFDLTVTHSFTADRYYDEDRLLDPYYLVDVMAGAVIPVVKGKIGTRVTCNNITGTTYEVIRLYPMPGRYWTVRLDYSF